MSGDALHEIIYFNDKYDNVHHSNKRQTLLLLFFLAFTITNGPQDTTVCTNFVAFCPCGFTGVDPIFVIPNWRIIKRRNGMVASNEIISGTEINSNTTDGLQWIPDPFYGNNSVLMVGPVGRADDQSSYQCIFELLGSNISSDVGTLTVLGELDSGKCTTFQSCDFCQVFG